MITRYDARRCDASFTFGLMVANLGPTDSRGSIRWLSGHILRALKRAQDDMAALVRGHADLYKHACREYGDALSKLLNDSAQRPRTLGSEFDFLRDLQDQHRLRARQ